jgi:hypothetical protein
LPLRAVSFSGDGDRPDVIKRNRQFATKGFLIKNLVSSENASEAVLASELYGEVGQLASASNNIHVGPTINTFFHETVAEGVLMKIILAGFAVVQATRTLHRLVTCVAIRNPARHLSYLSDDCDPLIAENNRAE